VLVRSRCFDFARRGEFGFVLAEVFADFVSRACFLHPIIKELEQTECFMPFLKRDRLLPARFGALNAPLMWLLAGLIGVLLFISTLVELRSVRRELLNTLDQQGKAMMASMQKALINATQGFSLLEETVADKLLSNARLLEELDANRALTQERLQRLATENGISCVSLFDEKGKRIMQSAPAETSRSQLSEDLLDGLLPPLSRKDTDELLLGFRQGRFGSGQRYAVAKKRRRGGFLVLNIDAQEMLEFRRQSGAGRLMRDIGRSRGMVYAMVQDSNQVVLASEGVEAVLPLKEDSFLLAALAAPDSILSRQVRFAERQVYEVAQALIVDNRQEGVLRIGLSSEHVSRALASSQQRAILSSILLLIVGVAAGNSLIRRQNYATLQQAYRRIETYTGGILQNMAEAVIAVDRENRVTLVNAAAEKFYGRPREKLVGVNCAKIDQELGRELRRAIDEESAVQDRECVLRPDSGDRTVLMSVAFLHDSQGTIDTAFVVIKDITEEKMLQQDLKRRDQLSAMGQLASGVAHEIRNPLNAISMIAQRFRNEFVPQSDSQEYAKLTQIVVDESRRINDIIQQFLQFARPAALQVESVDLSVLLRDVLTLLSSEAREKKVELDSTCTAASPVQLDRAKIQQVLINLVRNGIEACAAGDRVELSCDRQGENLVIRVQDTGIGMSADEVDKIFNLYYSSKEKGTGLGLSIVQQIVSQHGGTIQVESEPGRGSLFVVQLPQGDV